MSEFEELISKLLEKVPELSRSVIEERINEKKEKVGAGYLTDQGAIFLVAADLGVTLEQSQKAEVAIKDLYIGAKEVTLESRIIIINCNCSQGKWWSILFCKLFCGWNIQNSTF